MKRSDYVVLSFVFFFVHNYNDNTRGNEITRRLFYFSPGNLCFCRHDRLKLFWRWSRWNGSMITATTHREYRHCDIKNFSIYFYVKRLRDVLINPFFRKYFLPYMPFIWTTVHIQMIIFTCNNHNSTCEQYQRDITNFRAMMDLWTRNINTKECVLLEKYYFA